MKTTMTAGRSSENGGSFAGGHFADGHDGMANLCKPITAYDFHVRYNNKEYITYSNTLSNYLIFFYFTFFQIASGDNRSVVTSESVGRTILQRHEAENLDTTLTAIEEAHVDLRVRRQAELIRETARRGNSVMIRVSPKTARIISFMENLDLV